VWPDPDQSPARWLPVPYDCARSASPGAHFPNKWRRAGGLPRQSTRRVVRCSLRPDPPPRIHPLLPFHGADRGRKPVEDDARKRQRRRSKRRIQDGGRGSRRKRGARRWMGLRCAATACLEATAGIEAACSPVLEEVVHQARRSDSLVASSPWWTTSSRRGSWPASSPRPHWCGARGPLRRVLMLTNS
jgi:hypothetical protein